MEMFCIGFLAGILFATIFIMGGVVYAAMDIRKSSKHHSSCPYWDYINNECDNIS